MVSNKYMQRQTMEGCFCWTSAINAGAFGLTAGSFIILKMRKQRDWIQLIPTNFSALSHLKTALASVHDAVARLWSRYKTPIYLQIQRYRSVRAATVCG